MIKRLSYYGQLNAERVSWPLLVFLLLLLNVKLPVKIAGLLCMLIYNRKAIVLKDFFKQRYLLFYFSMILIGIVNAFFQFGQMSMPYLVLLLAGLCFWLMSAVIAWQLFSTVQKETTEKLEAAMTVFFILHVAVIFINLLLIMVETGSVNPYTYKGLNQKYYISTGDHIAGISFDASVTSAFIAVFGLLYFLYRNRYLLSLLSMAALLVMASNFANLVLVGTLVLVFIGYSTKLQKSFIVLYLAMLVVFMAKISPQNNEHVGRIFYQLIGKPYDLPPVKYLTPDELKKAPDSILTAEERKKKQAQLYIDSTSAVLLAGTLTTVKPVPSNDTIAADTVKPRVDNPFYQFHESELTKTKISQYAAFIETHYPPAVRDSLQQLYNWKNPGKWVAGEELYEFFKQHPGKIWLGTGIGNFASRLAFKATALNIAGRYPQQLQYISPGFLANHLYVYLYYHSQDQSQHEATNTPDTVYFQLAGEYGAVGLLLLFVCYFGFYLKRVSKNRVGLPLLLVLAGAFFAEYWFEQFSIVVLFELLFFIDIKAKQEEGRSV